MEIRFIAQILSYETETTILIKTKLLFLISLKTFGTKSFFRTLEFFEKTFFKNNIKTFKKTI